MTLIRDFDAHDTHRAGKIHAGATKTARPRSFGRKFNATRGEYYAGGSGIVMNQAALKQLGQAADVDFWGVWGQNKFGPEDLLTGVAMSHVNISIDVTLDSEGRHLFLPLGPQWEYAAAPQDHISRPDFWFWRIGVAPRPGRECCSKKWIGTHYIDPPALYQLDDLEASNCVSDPDQWPYLSLGNA